MEKEIKNKQTKKRDQYFEGIGRRKESIARVRVYPNKKGEFLINGKKIEDYFPIFYHQSLISSMITNFSLGENKYTISIKVSGGGKTGQAESIRLGLGRALLKMSPSLKKDLRKTGALTRDSRVVERKKYGLKKARRAPQWSKR